jgi:HEAT repeat protein
MGPAAQAAIPRLIEALQDADVSVAHTAATALESMVGVKKAAGPATDASPASPSVSPALSTLISGLKHGDASVRWRAAVALGGLGAGAVAAVPELVELLDDETELIRWEAAKALGKMGAAAKDAVPALAATLHGQQDAIVRRSAAEALGRIGAGADDGVPALIAALKDTDAAVAGASEQALLRIGRGAVSALIEAVKDEDDAVRLKAAEIVTRLGTDWSASPATSPGIAPEPSSPWEGKRRSPRLDVGVTLRLRRLAPRGSEGAEELTVTENLSEGGAKLVTSLPVEKSEIVELQEQEGPLRIRALVLNVSIGQDNRPRLHLQFFEVEGAMRLKDLLAQADPVEKGDPSQRAT